MQYRPIKVDDRWYVAFKCKAYGDFVIEFSKSFDTEEAADEDAKTGAIKPLDFSGEK